MATPYLNYEILDDQKTGPKVLVLKYFWPYKNCTGFGTAKIWNMLRIEYLEKGKNKKAVNWKKEGFPPARVDFSAVASTGTQIGLRSTET